MLASFFIDLLYWPSFKHGFMTATCVWLTVAWLAWLSGRMKR